MYSPWIRFRSINASATRSACGRINLSQLHELAAAFRRMKAAKRRNGSFLQKARDLDSRLHDLIADSCGNRFLAQEIGRLKQLFRAFRDASWEKRLAGNDYYRFAEEASEHLAIVQALIDGDARQASRAMARHIRAGDEPREHHEIMFSIACQGFVGPGAAGTAVAAVLPFFSAAIAVARPVSPVVRVAGIGFIAFRRCPFRIKLCAKALGIVLWPPAEIGDAAVVPPPGIVVGHAIKDGTAQPGHPEDPLDQQDQVVSAQP